MISATFLKGGEIVIDMIREVEEKEKEGLVKACPKCGQLILNSCYHNEEDIPSQYMKASEAEKILMGTIKCLKEELDEREKDLEKVRKVKENEK